VNSADTPPAGVEAAEAEARRVADAKLA